MYYTLANIAELKKEQEGLYLVIPNQMFLNVTLDHKKQSYVTRYICGNSQQYIAWVKMIHFFLCQKYGYQVKIMFHEDIL